MTTIGIACENEYPSTWDDGIPQSGDARIGVAVGSEERR
jgi:hypothetical protein